MILRSFLVALQFLTRIPVRFRTLPTDGEVSCSLVFYPLVGGLLGIGLVGALYLGAMLPLPVGAVMVLILWVGLTGALHLDGLADTCDALVGGMGDRDRMLAIMKDPCCGPMGVTVLVLALLAKFALLSALVTAGNPWPVLVACVLARVAVQGLFLTTPYVRAQGLGSALTAHMPRPAIWLSGIIACGAVVAVFDAMGGLAVLAALLVLAGVRWFLCRRLGGTTGDTAGALIEIVEIATLSTGVIIA